MAPSKSNNKKAKVEDKQKASIATKTQEPVVVAKKKLVEESSTTKPATGKSKTLNLQIIHRGG